MFTKIMTSALALGFASAALATTLEDNIQTCRLVAGKGPYSSFRIIYATIDGKPTGDLSVRVTYKPDFSAEKKTKTFRTMDFAGSDGAIAEIRGNVGSSVKISVYDSDFSTTTIDLGEDDNGVTAFVDFSSDGPAVRGFYTCTAYPKAISDYTSTGNEPTLVRPGEQRHIEDIVNEVVHEWYPGEALTKREITYSMISQHSDEAPGIIEVVVTDSNLADDSLAAERTTLVIERESGLVMEKKSEWRCQPGRGHEDWGTEKCR